MDPNQYQPQIPGQDPRVVDPNASTAVGATEYLNEIAVKPKGGAFLDKKMFLILGGLVFVIIIVVAIVASAPPKQQVIDVSATWANARIQYQNALNITKMVTDGLEGPIARNDAIASLVLGTHLAELNTKPGVIDIEGYTEMDIDATNSDLDTARIAGRLDSKFRDEIDKYIKEIITSLSKISGTANASEEDRAQADQYITELQIIQKRLSSR